MIPSPRPEHRSRWWHLLLLVLVAVGTDGCRSLPPPGAAVPRHGDEIVVAGRMFRTGTPVVLWMDPDGYDGYRVERRFSPLDRSDWESSRADNKDLSTPNRFGLRRSVLTAEQAERVRGGGWDLPLLQSVVDQFVLHYDASGTSRQCFKTLHDLRGLSIHFMLDLDGTIYQTLDLKERAWHATTSNGRSVGIEIANVGAFDVTGNNPFADWFTRDADGRTRILIPARLGESGIRASNFVARPARPDPVRGTIHGRELVQYDLTPQQYEALVRLTATLCRVFPNLPCDYPRNAQGGLLTTKLPDDQLARYRGLIGHFHIQANKVDPGPAFQWDHVVTQSRRLLESPDRADAAFPSHARLPRPRPIR